MSNMDKPFGTYEVTMVIEVNAMSEEDAYETVAHAVNATDFDNAPAYDKSSMSEWWFDGCVHVSCDLDMRERYLMQAG